MKQLIIAVFLITLLSATTTALGNLEPRNEVDFSTEIADVLTQNESAASLLRVAAYCPKSGERVAGQNKICYYDCLSGTVAITISSVSICPLSINR